MEALLFGLLILILSIISAFIGFGFQRMMDYDMIFEWYGNFLRKLPYFPNPRYPMHADAFQYKRVNWIYYLTKPLGACILCNTTWIGIIFSSIIFIMYDMKIIFPSICVGICSAGIVIIIQNVFTYIQSKL